MEGKVIGLGGVFIKFKDPDAMREWYKNILGLDVNDYGVLFSFNTQTAPKGYLQLGTFPQESEYFGSAEQQVMLNFRVDNITMIIERLQQNKVLIVNEIQEYEYGKFLHIEDPENNRIELWEPIDQAFSSEIQVEMR